MTGTLSIPPDYPKPFWHRALLPIVPGLLLMGVFLAPKAWIGWLGLLAGSLSWFATILLAAGVAVLAVRSLRWLADRALSHSYRFCPECAQPYQTEEPVHTCERCEHTFNTLQSRDKWRRVVLLHATAPFGPTPLKARRLPGGWSTRVLIVCLFLLYQGSQVVAEFVSSNPSIAYVPTPMPTKDGGQITVQIPTSIPPGQTELIIARINTFVPFFVMACACGYAIFAGVRFSRACKVATDHNYLVCGKCLYPLDSCPDDGNCPECGTDYDPHNLRSKWFRVLAQSDHYKAYKSGEIDEFMPL